VPFRRIPPLHGNVVLRWDGVEREQRVDWAELAFVWAATQDELNPDDESDPRIDPDGTEGWAVLDFDLGGPLGDPATVSGGRARASWTLGVHNLLDENYRIHGSGFDAPGRSLVVGLRLSL
jgi:outer membrane receptor protein involved in Fe transport